MTEWEVKKELIERLNRIRDKHTKKANELTKEQKFEEASDEMLLGLGVGEAIHEILYK